MGKLLEVIRRLAVTLIWLVGGFLGIGLMIEGWNGTDDTRFAGGVGFLVATFVIHKIVNWILLKDEKNAPPGNQ